MSPRRTRVSFVAFCTDVLHLPLTVPWRVLLAVSVDGVQPGALEGEEREAARTIFGPVDEVDPRLRRILAWRLGRASGKSTLAAALAVYCAWTVSLPREGHGHVPVAFIVSAARPLAKIAQGVARELVRGSDLERYVGDDTTDGFVLRRVDGRTVEIASVAASKGGANLRGRDVAVLVVDEAEFLGSEAGDYAITDRDQVSAVMPRLLGFVVLSSTPWPTDNYCAETFARNHGHPTDAVAALGTSLYMRPSQQLQEDRARELARDEENALREYDCVAGVRGGSHLFDATTVDAAVVEGRPLVVFAPRGVPVGAGADLALERDSSAIATVSNDGGQYELLEFDEVRPSRETALAPQHVVRVRFAPVARRHGCSAIMMDGHYRQSAIEHLDAEDLGFLRAPEGNGGKYDSYMHLRSLLRSGHFRLPPAPRLTAQLKAVTMTPIAGGLVRISSPRRAGQSGHGDIVSAVVLAAWAVREASAEPDWIGAMNALLLNPAQKPPIGGSCVNGTWTCWGNRTAEHPDFNSGMTAKFYAGRHDWPVQYSDSATLEFRAELAKWREAKHV